MFWSDRIAKDIIATGKYKPYWVDDMFTPSGFAHTGSLRGPLVHDIVYRSLIDAQAEATWTYVFNDFDCIDGLPPELQKISGQYLGTPLRLAPSPVEGYASFAEYFTKDFQQILVTLGVRAKFLFSYDMYTEGKFNEVIREALDHSETIQDIYQKVSGSNKREKNWLPLQVVCEKCGKLGTTRVHDWDGKTVAYTCEPHMVTWATGCGHEGRIDPFDGRAKLPWKVDWPAHWKVLGVTIEGAGKDHSSAGGSRDIAKEECKEVFHIENPYNLPYEFFLIGGKKMGSSKGLGLKARDFITLLPPEAGRFLFTRTDYRQAIEFNPVDTMAIPDLFDEYDRCWQAYIEGGDENFSRAFELSQITEVPKKEKVFFPRFRDVANYIQQESVDIEKKFTEIKGVPLTSREKKLLEERMTYAEVWIKDFAPKEISMQLTKDVPEEARTLSGEQKKYLRAVIDLLQGADDPDTLQTKLFEETKKQGIDGKSAFGAIYLATLGKSFGPKAAWFLLQYPKDVIIERLETVIK